MLEIEDDKSHVSLKLLQITLKVQSWKLKKAPINDRLRVSKVSLKFHIPTIYNFAVICQ